ncbi:MAG: PEP-utilizing enzyme [Candidatus Woesearchaeota archaeon]|nr:PEP-utilizing enzyme [Candidatus Woesearchaeota archaeon]
MDSNNVILLCFDSRKIVNNQNRLLEEVRISDGMKDKIELTQLLSTWQDERKELDLIGKHYQNEFLKQIAKKMRLSIDEIYFVHLKEIREFFRTGRIPSKKMIKSRMDLCVHVADIPLTEDVLFEGKDAEDIIEAFESIADEKELKGTIASYGKEKIIKGEVNVILNPAKSDFRKGQILVTTMTRPEFVPLMHHAKAIITDEGGVTTHAGIVSRELGIACIVGVRSATKLLKTGDKIEINMKTGEIRKI